MRYRCLVLDHDDTVVNSEEAVNYPSMLEALSVLRPGMELSREDFTMWTFREGFWSMIRNRFGFDDREAEIQLQMWSAYVRTHIPPAFPGIRELLVRQREAGGLICVSSHSGQENISRDYLTHFDLLPDRIFGHELGEENRKPAPYALDTIMEDYHLSPSDILVVDDLNTGYEMAASRGVDFAWAGWARLGFPEICRFMEERSSLRFRRVDDLTAFLFG